MLNTKISPLHQAAVNYPDYPAVIVDGNKLTYQQVSQKVLQLGQALLAQGLKAEDRLAIVSPNSLEMLLLYWACVDTGILFCPLSPKFPAAQLEKLIHYYQFNWLWNASDIDIQPPVSKAVNLAFSTKDKTFPEPLTPPKINFDSYSNIILTSGSSGMPKAVLHQLKQHIASAIGASSIIAIVAGDNWLLSLPLFHIGGLAILNRCAIAAACVVLQDKSIKASQQLYRDNISHASMVATQLHRMLNEQPQMLTKLKALLLGGGAISQNLIDELNQLNIPAFTSYGMTEMASQITTGKANSQGSSGQLLPNRKLTIKQGMIWVKGATLFAGYLTPQGIQKPLDNDGWFCTKDLGYWDHQGQLHITGRADNMFISGGENIQPEEIEAVLKSYPAIEEAIVFPMKDPEFGVLPAAIILGDLPNRDSIDNFIGQHIAKFKRPRHYFPWPKDMKQTGLKINRQQIIRLVKQGSNQ